MKDWRPDIDLSRLLAALDEALRAVTDAEVQETGMAVGRSPARVAKAVRNLVAAAIDAADDPEPGVPFAAAARREYDTRRH
jgi:hypothetical protein